jgi:GcrA cell cycle regulator
MWTEERIELLQKLWGQGYSASQIANQLQHGVTRNAVIGKIHRLSKRSESKTSRVRNSGYHRTPVARRPPSPAPHAMGQHRTAPPEWALRPHQRMILVEEPGLATSTTLAAHMCRWPIGDPDTSEFSFCGQASADGRPYCEGHARVAYKRGSGGEADVNRLLARYL